MSQIISPESRNYKRSIEETSNNKLTKKQKEAIGLLSIGTFLEYFDLMLYVHMAVLLNELFFPKADPFTASLLSAFAFCSTYLLRPFAALLFGYIGDNIGRKHTVVITTFLMSFSCLVMANLPTYAQIGITATWIITICRMIQGVSSMGEVVGAGLYLCEITKPPSRYFAVSLITVAATIGVSVALGVAYCVTSLGINWRMIFWFGTVIALVGSIARTSLRESGEFVNAKKRLASVTKDTDINFDKKLESLPKPNKKNTIFYFIIQSTGPLWFCIAYIYCGTLMKNQFGFSVEQIIQQNFIVGMVELIVTIFLSILVIKIHPLKILSVKIILFFIFSLFIPTILNSVSTSFGLLIFQLCIVTFAPTGFPAGGVFYMRFPVLKRFTYTSLIFSTSRALMYAISSFGLVYLTEKFGYYGILILVMPMSIGFFYALSYFKGESNSGSLEFEDVRELKVNG